MVSNRNLFKAGDIIVIMAVMLLAVCIMVWFWSARGSESGRTICIIRQDNTVIREIDLSVAADDMIHLEGIYHNTIEIKDGRVRFSDSSCPNQLCVHTGWIDKSYQTAVCLPNQVVIEIRVEEAGQVDIIT